jgi:iron complex transport system ATP-binding protein
MEHHTGRRFTELSVSTHDLNAAASDCDRLHVLYDGHVVVSGPPREVLQPALSADVFGVRATVVDHPLTGDPLIAFDHLAPPHNPDSPEGPVEPAGAGIPMSAPSSVLGAGPGRSHR